MGRFCARCGRGEAPGSPLVGGLCPECFVSTRRLVEVPERIEVVRCRVCGAVRTRGGRFSRIDAEDYVRGIVEECVAKGRLAEGVERATVSGIELREEEALVGVVGEAAGTVLRQNLRVRLTVEETTCPECFMRKAGSFGALVQLRPGNPRAARLVSRIAGELEGQPGVVEIKREGDGVDVYVVEKSAAARIVGRLKASYVTRVVSTWEGFKYAQRRPRAVFSVRVYAVERGDAVELPGGIYEVVEVSPRAVVLRNPGTGDVFSLDLGSFWRRSPTIRERARGSAQP